MPTIAEAMAADGTPISDVLDAGIETISYDQSIVFTKYIRTPLPLDGSIFWVRADLIGAATLTNPSVVGPLPVASTSTIAVTGSLHRSSDRQQEEDQTVGIQSIIFTSESEIQPLAEINPVVMWLGQFEGVRFSFGRRNSYYAQANKHHYVGDAVYPIMGTQIIDNLSALTQHKVVSNSLPIWLSLNKFFPVYSSFLLPDNIPPPYAAVHVIPGSVRAMQAAPYVARDGSRWQLVAERVRVRLFGARNDTALDYVDYIEQATLDDDFGLMNMPVVSDLKRAQAELPTIAIAKEIEFEVSYYQARANEIARQLILTAIPSYHPGDTPSWL